MGQVYEDLYQHLISEGIDDSVATSVVNNMYDKEQYHDVEQLDEAAFRAASMIGRVAAKVFRAGKITPRAARGIGASTLRTLNRRGSEAFQRGVRRRNWTPDRALPSGTSAGTRKATLDSLLKAKPPTKSGALVGPGKGGPLAPPTGTTAGLGATPKIEKVKVKDLGPAPSSGGPTRYQGTRSGGQLQPGGGTSSRMGKGQQKAEIAASGTRNVGPATPAKGSPKPPALPASGQSSNRRNVAAATAATAAVGTKGTGVKTGTTSAIVKRKPSLGDKVKGALAGTGKVALGAAALGIGAGLMSGDKKASTPKKDTAPATPKGGVVADKAPTKPTAPAKPAVSTKKRMTKIDRDMKELMGMRAASMDRQGRSKDAAKLRSEIEKKFAGYED